MNIEKNNEIYTERLILRRFNQSDFENYYDILKQEEVSKWLGARNRKSKEDNKLIGHCGLKPLEDIQEIELLYAFDPKFWGNGYATESARTIIKFAQDELKLKRLVAIVYPSNDKSCNVIEKLGFQYK